jgi:hypothetical protein
MGRAAVTGVAVLADERDPQAMSVFLNTNHLILRNPDGSDGNVQAMAAAGFRAVYCNVRDYPPEAWQTIRDRARQANVECGPWARTATGGSWDEMMLQRLVQTADTWGSSLIVNSEKELDGYGDALTRHIRDVCGDRDWALSMEAWPYANVDWTPLSDIPVLPQIFPVESDAAKNADACRTQWHTAGIQCVVFTFGAYAGQTPSLYDRLSPYGVYTGDDCAGQYAAWSPQGSCDPCTAAPTPPPDPEDDMEPVTDQQGRDAIGFAVQAAAQNWGTDTKPRARLTVCRRIAQPGNDDPKWNTIRDQVVALLDGAGVPP